MARNRQSTALFEVIKGSQAQSPANSPMRTPNWWFGRASSDNTTPISDPAPIESQPPDQAAPDPAHASETITFKPAHRPELIVHLSYHRAALCAFVLLVAFVLTFVLGQRTSRSSAPVLTAMTTEELRTLPAQPDVLEVARPQAIDPPAVDPAHTQSAGDSRQPKTWNDPRPPNTLVVQDARRTIGLNYVLVQSYPKEEEAMALSARDLLVKSGIECTVEKGLPGWKQDWFCLVGTSGFDKIRNSREFDAYIQRIMDISDKFAGKAKFKKFEPLAYKWRGARAIG